ncbi:hypothetical protein LX16_4351 [Stackebrandtia albiflava]|uniref:Uncharacterized protein n=1 Tax=Stackebrandtia albiflava TaxID=406432 RepID=A0A562UR99_9ACTN|nr:hypothetical protein [Stackebrandtia albiflava]TWJ08131.1 hypothetical protein LX16_4351 [Stackebrandtia albiflava]
MTDESLATPHDRALARQLAYLTLKIELPIPEGPFDPDGTPRDRALAAEFGDEYARLAAIPPDRREAPHPDCTHCDPRT